jgi:hypothetical protein
MRRRQIGVRFSGWWIQHFQGLSLSSIWCMCGIGSEVSISSKLFLDCFSLGLGFGYTVKSVHYECILDVILKSMEEASYSLVLSFIELVSSL